ncbi:GGDEF domain-containing protein [Photobacterium frigidiphilum]|uniref:GGDEF domain-containing protein n=1 Tax=Photobacterium frigidiphilum TaxID=264736 RepID=UPI003D14E7BA
MRENFFTTIKSKMPHFYDLWSSQAHSLSFQNTRSDYLRNRISLLSVVLAVLVSLWIPFDILFLTSDQSIKITFARLFLSCFFFFLALNKYQFYSLRQIQFCIALFPISLNLFYLYCSAVLDFPESNLRYAYIYTLLPIIHVAILTILPITFKESLSLLSITAITQIFTDYYADRLFAPEYLAIYWLQSVLALMVIWSQVSKLHMLMRLYRQAILDPLTGIYNRRMLLKIGKKAMIECNQKNEPFSVMLFDIDKFKRINDTWGHSVGDKVLTGFTAFVQSKIRKTDFFGRYGGEEFILFLPNCTPDTALKISNRMLTAIRELKMPIDIENQSLSITTCIGISTYSENDTLASMLERADLALYKCKHSGRDCSNFHPIDLQYESDERLKIAEKISIN